MAGSYRIKISSAMKPFVGRVSRNGAIQRAFRDAPWRQSLSRCVASGVSPGMSGGAIKDTVRECAKTHAKGVQIAGFPGTGQKGKSGSSQRLGG